MRRSLRQQRDEVEEDIKATLVTMAKEALPVSKEAVPMVEEVEDRLRE